MNINEINLTDMEKALLKGARINEFGDAYNSSPWVWSVIDYSGLTGAQASGVISSLVKKGLITVDGKRCGASYDDDTSLCFTELGRKVCDTQDITNRRDRPGGAQ
jgi:hypothetical protein